MTISAFKNKKETQSPILVIDKVGVIGEAIARHFSKNNLVVLVSEKLFSRETSSIIHVPFKKKIPQVPDNEYSKFFLVDDGGSVTRESAFSFIDKAVENSAPLYFIGSIRNIDVEHADDIANSYNNAKVLLFGDLFDDALAFDKKASVNQFITSVRKDQKIQILGDGLALNFPITFIDTIKLIIKATELDLQQKIIMLFNGQPITDVSLANVFKKINPALSIDFIRGKSNKKIYIPDGAMHALNKYDVESKIKELDLGKEEKKQKEIKNNSSKKSNVSFVWLASVVIFIFLLPFITTYSLLFLGKISLASIDRALDLGDLEKARSSAVVSSVVFNASAKTHFILNKELNLLRFENISNDINKKITTGKYLSEATQEIISSIAGFELINSGKTDSPRDIFYTSSNTFNNGLDLIEKSKSISQMPEKFSKTASDLSFLSELLSSPEISLNILGFDEEKKYLVIELNNKNNTPAGGEVGRIRLVFIKNGQITGVKNISQDDLGIYDENKIEVPFYAKRYMGVKTPSISNSFYKIGFSQNAKDIINIYSSVNSQPIDGVIGMTSSYFDNVGELSLFNFIKEFGRGVREKNILVSVSDRDIQKVFDTKNWTGGIYDSRYEKQGIVNDYLGVIESSISKSINDFKISKTVSKNLILSEKGILTSTVTIAINNNDRASYKSYIQLLLPNKTVLSEIKFNSFSQKIINAVTDPNIFGSKNFKPPPGLEVERHSESGKEVVGFLVELAPESIKTITISYDLPYLIKATEKSFKYSFSLYKQPGIYDYNLGLSFSLPPDYQIIKSEKIFDIKINKDKNFTATLSQK